MSFALRCLAPWIAVAVFWIGLGDAWLTILAYHAQILFWARRSGERPPRPDVRRLAWFALPAALAGPLMWLLLPHMAHTELSAWLAAHRLDGLRLAAMLPYYGLVHPLLEQYHWRGLRARGAPAHLAFAGYHVLVLASLLKAPWLGLCFAVLVAASRLWRELERRPGGGTAAAASHLLADVGIVLVAWVNRQ